MAAMNKARLLSIVLLAGSAAAQTLSNATSSPGATLSPSSSVVGGGVSSAASSVLTSAASPSSSAPTSVVIPSTLSTQVSQTQSATSSAIASSPANPSSTSGSASVLPSVPASTSTSRTLSTSVVVSAATIAPLGSSTVSSRPSSASGGASSGGSSSSSPSRTSAIPTLPPIDASAGFTRSSATDGNEGPDINPPPISPAEHAGEALAIVSERTIAAPEAQNLALLETAYFRYFVMSAAPAAGGGGGGGGMGFAGGNANISLPANVASCPSPFTRKRSAFEEWIPGLDFLESRQSGSKCKVINRLDIDIHFNYIKNKTTSARPNDLETRVKKNVEFLQTIYNPMGVYFNYVKNEVGWWKPTGADDNWSTLSKGEDKLRRWQMKTRELGKMVLTVWLVNELKGADGKNTINGYGTLPHNIDKVSAYDGIVMSEWRAQAADRNPTTLVHEVGHWLGLAHPFGELDQHCTKDDGLLDTSQLSGLKGIVYECTQQRCDGVYQQIYNWMSYSSCRGQVRSESFTWDQQSRIFTQTTWYRRGFNPGECLASSAAAAAAEHKKMIKKRSAMTDLVRGQCPDVARQAAIIMQVYKESPEALRDKPLSQNAAVGVMGAGMGLRSVVMALGAVVLVQSVV